MNFVQLTSFIFIAGIFILIFGIIYLKSKENLALIERNKDIPFNKERPFLLTIGIVLIFISIGFLTGFILTKYVLYKETLLAYLTSVLFFAGIGFLIAHYLHQRK